MIFVTDLFLSVLNFRRAEKLIENFKRNWSELKLTITPKHHLLTNHVLEFCRKFDRTPMVFSEHDIESSHRFFGGRLGFYRPGLPRSLAMIFQNGVNMERAPSRGESFIVSLLEKEKQVRKEKICGSQDDQTEENSDEYDSEDYESEDEEELSDDCFHELGFSGSSEFYELEEDPEYSVYDDTELGYDLED